MKILFVCMGNICRSPTAEAVFRKLAADNGLAGQLEIDSAGTHGFHVGRPPDARAIEHAGRRGYDLTMLRAREVVIEDFDRFDHVIAMDDENVQMLKSFCPDHQTRKIKLLMDYASASKYREVPDPYQGGPKEFELALDLIEQGCQALVNKLIEQRRARAVSRLRNRDRDA